MGRGSIGRRLNDCQLDSLIPYSDRLEFQRAYQASLSIVHSGSLAYRLFPIRVLLCRYHPRTARALRRLRKELAVPVIGLFNRPSPLLVLALAVIISLELVLTTDGLLAAPVSLDSFGQ